jgi:hypothetical protein
MTNLSASDRKRLAAILSLLGSSASGERENAARLAEQFRNRRGLTWAELLATPPAPPEAWAAAAPKPNPSRYSSRQYERTNSPLHQGNRVRWIRLNGWTDDVRHKIKWGICAVVLILGFAVLISYLVD